MKSPEATQEIDVGDVLEVSELAPRALRDVGSSPSIRPVGLDLKLAELQKQLIASSQSALGGECDANHIAGVGEETCQIRLVARRKELSRYVIGAVAISCAILIASFVKHTASADVRFAAPASNHAPTADVAPPVRTAGTASSGEARFGAPTPNQIPVADIPPPPAVSPFPATQAATTVESASGTLRFAVARSAWIWVDGKRLAGTSAIVSCGKHQVKVGYNSRHTVAVPCGAEVVVSH